MCLPPVPFLLEAVHAVFFDRGHGLVDGLTPCVTVCSECRPLVMVNVAGTKSLFESVFVPLIRSPYVAMVRGEFVIQNDLGQAMVCFTPLLIAKGSERSPLSLTWPRWSSCS